MLLSRGERQRLRMAFNRRKAHASCGLESCRGFCISLSFLSQPNNSSTHLPLPSGVT